MRKLVTKLALKNLSNYYLACLRQDGGKEISVLADGDDLEYAELASLPNTDNENLFNTREVQNVLGKIRKDRGKLATYLGYPCALKKGKPDKNNREIFFVEPVILFPIEVGDETPEISQELPIFNFSVLKRFTNATRDLWMSELAQLEKELNFNSENEILKPDDAAQRLHDIRSEWPWREAINPDELSTCPPLGNVTEEGIYNRAVLVIGLEEDSPYSKGLESELQALSEMPITTFKHTVLGQWLERDIDKNKKEESPSLLEVLPLNSEQRQAIKHSLENSLTIITGPPGTGKSQVVTNLLVNAAWRGKKVLFASKNNKAVDVVEHRINSLGNRPVLLRMGSGQYQTKLAEHLITLFKSPTLKNDREEFDYAKQRYEELENRFLQLEEKETALIQLRNKTDELDKAMEKINKDISPQVFKQLKTIDPQYFSSIVDSFQRNLRKAGKDNQGFLTSLFWNFLKKKRYEKLQIAIKELCSIASQWKVNLPAEIVSDETIQIWVDFSKTAGAYSGFMDTIQEYKLSLKYLQQAESLESISREKFSLVKDMSASAKNLWEGWLRLQPSRLSAEDRASLSKYHALLKMVIDAGEERLSPEISREYSQLSEKSEHLLPVWAVTSLSAHGRIPFQPGYFDIIVIDESSQCDIASALPLLYRAKQAVIIGDPEQLQHISGLQKGQDQRLLEKYNLIRTHVQWAYSYNSLFDLAFGLASTDDIINLQDHHRSHSEIIGFSNQEFYKGNLRVATNYENLKFIDSKTQGIYWINVAGDVKKPHGGGAVNELEAKSVLKVLEKLVVKRNYTGSVGVVTPFRAQANLIRRIVTGNSTLHSELLNLDFLVDTVHKFQGDERDVMIFSPVVSKNMPKSALTFLRNNGNLFNVAITRARAILLVIGDESAIINCEVSYLENFVTYIQQLRRKLKNKAEQPHKDPGAEYPVVAHPDRVSEWEHILYKKLYQAGINAIPQYEIDKYTLDFALFTENKNLAIEVDGERYHRNWTGEICRKDQIRNQRLLELGWDVQRFWVYEIRDDIDECVETIKKWRSHQGLT